MTNLPTRSMKQILETKDSKLTPEEKAIKEEYLDAQNDDSGFTPQPMKIEVAHGSQLFKFPDEEKTPPSGKAELIILGSMITRSYWEPGKDDGDLWCSSIGGSMGELTEAGAKQFQRNIGEKIHCMNCTVPGEKNGTNANDFGSAAKGKGKSCKEMRRTLVFHPAYKQGLILVIPPSSIMAFDTYMTNMRAAGKRVWGMKTEIALKKNSSGSLVWSTMQFAPGEELADADLMVALAIRKQFKDSLAKVDDDDYISQENKTQDPDDDLPF